MLAKTDYKQKFKEKNCCVIIPTYNNELTIAAVITDVLEYCDDVFVVNDGSTDSTPSILENFEGRIEKLGYSKNRGKGFAMQTGFREAINKGFKYAITIDSDGQHYASDLPVFIDALDAEPQAVLIGARQLNKENMSGGSSFANKFSNFWFKVETAITLEDTQSGYRLYPLEPMRKMKFFTKKYEFEIEVIVRLSWQGVKIMCVPINVFYPTRQERVSHFRPFKDFSRISVLNTVLVTLAFLFFLPRNLVRNYKGKKLKNVIKEDLIGVDTPTHIKAFSIGFGIFMGIVPIWGYQLLVGFFLAHLLKLNKSIFFVFANISIPPMIPLILYLSFVFGAFIMGEPTWVLNIHNISFETLKSDILLYIVGSVALALVAGTMAVLVSFGILKVFERKRKQT